MAGEGISFGARCVSGTKSIETLDDVLNDIFGKLPDDWDVEGPIKDSIDHSGSENLQKHGLNTEICTTTIVHQFIYRAIQNKPNIELLYQSDDVQYLLLVNIWPLTGSTRRFIHVPVTSKIIVVPQKTIGSPSKPKHLASSSAPQHSSYVQYFNNSFTTA